MLKLRSMLTKRGFTLIELLIAVSILAVIAAVGYTSYAQAQLLARDARRKEDIRALRVAIELYYQRNSNSHPASLDDLTPAYINTVPKDPSDGTTPYYYNKPATPPPNFVLCAKLENANDSDRESTNDPDVYDDCSNPAPTVVGKYFRLAYP